MRILIFGLLVHTSRLHLSRASYILRVKYEMIVIFLPTIIWKAMISLILISDSPSQCASPFHENMTVTCTSDVYRPSIDLSAAKSFITDLFLTTLHHDLIPNHSDRISSVWFGFTWHMFPFEYLHIWWTDNYLAVVSDVRYKRHLIVLGSTKAFHCWREANQTFFVPKINKNGISSQILYNSAEKSYIERHKYYNSLFIHKKSNNHGCN